MRITKRLSLKKLEEFGFEKMFPMPNYEKVINGGIIRVLNDYKIYKKNNRHLIYYEFDFADNKNSLVKNLYINKYAFENELSTTAKQLVQDLIKAGLIEE